MNTPRVEEFLTAFHDRTPGGSARAFAECAVQDAAGVAHRSTYHALRQAIVDAGPALPGGPVVDLACGDGHLLGLLSGLGRPMIGVDLSGGELAAAARRGVRATLVRARAQSLPLADASVAVVSCHMALQLMTPPAQVLAEIARVLGDEGRLFALVPRAAAEGSLPDPVHAAYVDALGTEPRAERWRDLRFEGRSLRDADGLRELLSPWFDALSFVSCDAAQRLTPDAAWAWMSGMYDRALLDDAAWPRVRERFLPAVAPHVDADATVTLIHRYLLVDARRRR